MFRRAFKQRYREGLAPSEVIVLVALKHRGPTTARHLEAETGRDRSTFSRAMQALEAKGLVTIDPVGTRSANVPALTTNGDRAAGRLIRAGVKRWRASE